MRSEIDKIGATLAEQRFLMLQDIAAELADENISFPTSFDVLVHLRNALADPNWSSEQIAKLLHGEPVIAARLVGLANSVALRAGGNKIVDLKGAIHRLGLNAVRAVVMAVSMDQMNKVRQVAVFKDVLQRLWDHSLRTASAAYVLSKNLTRLNPDEAMLAGLIHDIGAFYLFYRAAQYDELLERPDSAIHLAVRWHEPIGYTILLTLGLPDEIAEAVREHDEPRPGPTHFYSLKDVLYVANIMGGGVFEWPYRDNPDDTGQLANLDERFTNLIGEIARQEQEIRGFFA